MKDRELELFFGKIKSNPWLFYQFIIFFYKAGFDLINRKISKKKQTKLKIVETEHRTFYSFNSLAFVTKYTSVQDNLKEPEFNFKLEGQSFPNDEQFEYYRFRFNEISFCKIDSLDATVDKILSWVGSTNQRQLLEWHPYTVSERIVNFSIFISRFCEYLDWKVIEIILNSIKVQSDYLVKNIELHLGNHNHLLNNSRALLYATAIFNNQEFCRYWLEKALKLIKSQINEQVLDDGCHSEQSSTYHLLITRTLWEFRELFYILNIDFEYESKLKNMVHYSNELIYSQDSIPLYGHITPDHHVCELIGLISLWVKNSRIAPSAYAQLFVPNPLIEEYRSENRNFKLIIFELAGIGILSHNSIQASLYNDPRCSIKAHGDQCQLGIDLFWAGTHLIRDCGLTSYDLNNDRRWFESWQGQSVCVLENLDPIVSNWRKNQLPTCHYSAYSTLETCFGKSIIASHSCFSRLSVATIMSREVSINDSTFTLIDSIESKNHLSYFAMFHFGNLEVSELNGQFLILDHKKKSIFRLKYSEVLNYEILLLPYATKYGEKMIGTSILFTSKTTETGNFIYHIEKVN